MSRTTKTLTPGRSPTSASAARPSDTPHHLRPAQAPTAGRRFDSPFAACARTIEVDVNGQPAGQVDRLIGDGAIARFEPGPLVRTRARVRCVVVEARHQRPQTDRPRRPDQQRRDLRLPSPRARATRTAGSLGRPHGPCRAPTLFIAGDSTAANGAPAPSAGASTSRRSSTRRSSRSSTSPAEGGAAGRSSPRGSGTACSKA